MTAADSHPVHPFNICLTHSPAYGGIFRAVQDFSLALNAPILSFDDGRAAFPPVEPGPAVHRVRCGAGWLHRDCHWLSHAARHEAEQIVCDSDLLIVHSLFRAHAAWASRVVERTGGGYLAVPHGCLDPWGLSQRWLAKRLWLRTVGSRYLARARYVVFATRRERDKAAPYVPASRAVVVPWPVEVQAHVDRPGARFRLRTRLGVPAESLVLLFVGRLHSMKRLPATIDLFCTNHRAPWHLVIAGMDGDTTRERLRTMIPHSFRDRVHLVGEVSGDQRADAYAGSDAFVSFSYRENFGYAMAEAASFGLPLLVSEGHDLAHDMPMSGDRSFAAGWMVPTHGPSEWVAAITALLTSSVAERSARGQCGQEFVGRNLSFAGFRQALAAGLGIAAVDSPGAPANPNAI